MNRFAFNPSVAFARSHRRGAHASSAAACLLAIALLGGCTDAATPQPPASGLRATLENAEEAARDVRDTSASDVLKPGQRLQGTLTLDIGEGSRTYRIIATKLADDLGKRAAERLASTDGKAALDKANARVGGKTKVAASDVQELVDAFAGKTMYSAQVHTIDIVKRQQVSIEGEAADGSRVTLGFSLPIGGDEVLDSSLDYRPDRKRAMEDFEARSRDGAMRLTLERLQRGDALAWSVAGTFEATNLQPGVLAKKLAGRSIARASGRFDVTEVHVREP